MPIVVVYSGSGVDLDAYAPYEAELQKTPVPPEALVHQVARDGDEFLVVDVWSSRAAFERWTESFIKPNLARYGITYAEPRVYDLVAMAMQDGVDPYKVLSVRAPVSA